MPPLEESLMPAGSEGQVEEVDDFGPGPIDISLEHFESAGSQSAIHPGVEIDMSTVEGLESQGAPAKAESGEIEDVSSEFLDTIEEELEAPAPSPKPRVTETQAEFGTGMDDVTAEFLDIEESIAAPQARSEIRPSSSLSISIFISTTGSPAPPRARKPKAATPDSSP